MHHVVFTNFFAVPKCYDCQNSFLSGVWSHILFKCEDNKSIFAKLKLKKVFDMLRGICLTYHRPQIILSIKNGDERTRLLIEFCPVKATTVK